MEGQGLEKVDRSYWNVENNNDLISLEPQLRRENRIILKIKMTFYILFWKLRKYAKVNNLLRQH